MNKEVNKTIQCSLEAVESYDFPKDEPFNLQVPIDGVMYEFMIHLKENSDKILVLASGKIQEKTQHDRSKPYYQRSKWYFDESTIYFNDPTLYIDDDITTGWAIGTKDDWYLEKIAEIIKKIAKNLFKYNIDDEYGNLLFYGSMSGGFMAIMLSILVENSISIAEMPHLEVFRTNQRPLLNHIFKNMSIKQIHDQYEDRLNVLELIKKTKYIPKTFLIIDYNVNEELNNNYITFLNQITQLPQIESKYENRITVEFKSTQKGQHLLKPWQLREFISNIHKIRDKNYYDSSTMQRQKLEIQDAKVEKYEKDLKEQISEITRNNKEIEQYKKQLNTHIKQIQENDKQIKQYQEEIEQQKQKIDENNHILNQYKHDQEEVINKQKTQLTQKDDIINEQIQTITDKDMEIQHNKEEIHQKQDAIIKLQKENKAKNIYLKKYEKQIRDDKTTQQYIHFTGKFKKKLLRPLPYLYILLKAKDKLKSLKIYRQLVKIDNNYFDVGYYLNSNKDVERKKWCKILTPQTHYMVFGIREKRKPSQNIDAARSIDEILDKI